MGLGSLFKAWLFVNIHLSVFTGGSCKLFNFIHNLRWRDSPCVLWTPLLCEWKELSMADQKDLSGMSDEWNDCTFIEIGTICALINRTICAFFKGPSVPLSKGPSVSRLRDHMCLNLCLNVFYIFHCFCFQYFLFQTYFNQRCGRSFLLLFHLISIPSLAKFKKLFSVPNQILLSERI